MTDADAPEGFVWGGDSGVGTWLAELAEMEAEASEFTRTDAPTPPPAPMKSAAKKARKPKLRPPAG